MPDEGRSELENKVARHLSGAIGSPVVVRRLEPLGGGACQDNYRLEIEVAGAVQRLVLRSDPVRSLEGSLDRRDEALVIEAAVSRRVKTPAARWPAEDLVRPGASAYFLDWVEGTAIGRQVIKLASSAEASAALAEALAAELTKIHSITAITHPQLFAGRDRLERTDPLAAGLNQLRRSIDQLGRPRPALEYAFDWLSKNRPDAREVTLVHGDFRNGNFMVTAEGLSAILDWEFSHFGSPYEDLAWIAVRDWRFGALDKPIGGFARRASFYQAYQRASRRELSPRRLHWWEVLGNVRWAAGAVQQGLRYEAGERDLELIAIARRAPEMEHEALRLIEQGATDAGSS
jgi:aminoglycoside phosphotransferase (APT) family kinase protein